MNAEELRTVQRWLNEKVAALDEQLDLDAEDARVSAGDYADAVTVKWGFIRARCDVQQQLDALGHGSEEEGK